MRLSLCELSEFDDFIFLDSSLRLKESRSYLFVKPLKVITAFCYSDIVKCFSAIDKHVDKGYWISGYIQYDAGLAFLPEHENAEKFHTPLLWFGVYENPIAVTGLDDSRAYKPYIKVSDTITRAHYFDVIKDIKKELSAGNTYQVNYTFQKKIKADCSAENLYFSLRQNQHTEYSCFIKNQYGAAICFSPELFFSRKDNRLVAKPMKGTVPRGNNIEEDLALSEFLKNDEKNRAENLMIVDLLRNDIGQVTEAGSVKVLSMFDISGYKTLYQMTSTIEGRLKDGMGYTDIFRALFPCGSVIGAPKLNTMRIIKKIEKDKRGIYCGAIGYISPKKKAIFNVPIRVLQRSVNARDWIYGVGSGIV